MFPSDLFSVLAAISQTLGLYSLKSEDIFFFSNFVLNCAAFSSYDPELKAIVEWASSCAKS